MAMKKPVQARDGGPGGTPILQDPSSGKSIPRLFEFLRETEWDDGSRREPGSITIFIQDGSWKACLSDKAMGRVAFLSAGTMAELLKGVDGALEADTLDWRTSRWDAKGGKRKGG